MAITPNFRYAVVLIDERTAVVYDLKTGGLLRRFKGPQYVIKTAAVSADSRRLAVAGAGGVFVWNIADGKKLREFHASADYFNHVALSDDGGIVAAAGVEDPICFWDVQTGKAIDTERDDLFTSALVFAPGSRQYLAANYGHESKGKREINLCDTRTGKTQATLLYAMGDLTSAAYSADAQQVAAAGGSRDDRAVVTIWQARNGAHGKTWTWKDKPVQAIVFSKDGKRLYTASGNVIRIWDAAAGKYLGSLGKHKEDINILVLSPDGRSLASGSYRQIKIWKLF